MSQITQIANGESGGSVRSKLNSIIDKYNTMDGKIYAEQASSDAKYVNKAGDTMSGPLAILSKTDTNTDVNTGNKLKIATRYQNSGITHGNAGHITQITWGNSTNSPETSINDGGWGLEIGPHGNPYAFFSGNDIKLGRTDGDIWIKGNKLTGIWNNFTPTIVFDSGSCTYSKQVGIYKVIGSTLLYYVDIKIASKNNANGGLNIPPPLAMGGGPNIEVPVTGFVCQHGQNPATQNKAQAVINPFSNRGIYFLYGVDSTVLTAGSIADGEIIRAFAAVPLLNY